MHVEAKGRKDCDLHPSLASLGDGLLSSVGSQRDEAKRQAFSPAQDSNPGPFLWMTNNQVLDKAEIRWEPAAQHTTINPMNFCSLPSLAIMVLCAEPTHMTRNSRLQTTALAEFWQSIGRTRQYLGSKARKSLKSGWGWMTLGCPSTVPHSLR